MSLEQLNYNNSKNLQKKSLIKAPPDTLYNLLHLILNGLTVVYKEK